MTTARKLILVLGFALNIAAITTVSIITLHRHAANRAPVVDLGTIIVTPGNASSGYAVNGTVDLGSITVTPQDSATAKIAVSSSPAGGKTEPDEKADSATAVVMEALDTLSPGQYLNMSASMRALNTLVFERLGG